MSEKQITFADKFRELKIENEITFRTIVGEIGYSISYWSDIAAGRKNPPELNSVDKLQKLLGVTDNCLMELAQKERRSTVEVMRAENENLAAERDKLKAERDELKTKLALLVDAVSTNSTTDWSAVDKEIYFEAKELLSD